MDEQQGIEASAAQVPPVAAPAPVELRSVVRSAPSAAPRRLAKVPFVELADGRLQGVVSSGSDIERVYVSSIGARNHALNCSTNNNRPCGGLRGSPCKHLQALVEEALAQFGGDRVARFLHLDLDLDAGAPTAGDVLSRLRSQPEPTPASVVFSRFLRHLSYLELPDTTAPIPELHWFPSSSAEVA